MVGASVSPGSVEAVGSDEVVGSEGAVGSVEVVGWDEVAGSVVGVAGCPHAVRIREPMINMLRNT